MDQYLYADITKGIIAAAFEVHRALGPGFVEGVYERSLAHELQLRGMDVQRQVHIPIHYKSELVGEHVLDLIVDNKVIVELKAVKEFADIHTSVVLSYLAATKLSVALILNFSKKSVEIKRLAL